MIPMPETVFGRDPVFSSDTEGRRASPFRSRGARSESAERVRSTNTVASFGYRQVCEEVISPLMAGLTTRMGVVEVRMDTYQSASKQEVDGLKAQITVLNREIQEIRSVANLALSRVDNHTHNVPIHMKDSLGKFYVFNGNLIKGSRDAAIPVVHSLEKTGTKQVAFQQARRGGGHYDTFITQDSYDCQPAGLHYESDKAEFH